MKIHGKEYTEVKDRIVLFLKDNPNGYIQTHVEWHSDDFSKICIKALVFKDHAVQATTGIAYEERTESTKEVNFTSWVENCETSAIGRALANMNIGVTESRPSAEEMQKVERMSETSPLYDELLKSLISTSFLIPDDLNNWIEVNIEQINELPESYKAKLRSKIKIIKNKLEQK